MRLSGPGWAQRALAHVDRWQSDRLVAESNQGGDLVRSNIQAQRRNQSVRLIHASRGKVVRAEPVVGYYEQGRVHHVGSFPTLEREMVRFPTSHGYDDEIDSMVYAITELMRPRIGLR